MLPKFPEFKKLALADQDDIEKISSQYQPYSDFDFPSLWSWDVNDNTMISQLNGNLVAILSDHFTNTPFYSYLGNNDLDKTLKQLFAFSVHSKNSIPQLKLVPEVSLNGINLKKYLIEIDLNNYDYIYDLKQISTYPGIKFSDKRRKINNFLRNHSDTLVQTLDLNNSSDQKDIVELHNRWNEKRASREEDNFLKKESIAIKRFLDVKFKDTIGIGIKAEDKLIGYSLFTLLPNQYAVGHFSKGDIAYHGIYEYLMRESAALLLEQGRELLNYQEDLGMPGLRFWKNSFKPATFLRKYSIREL